MKFINLCYSYNYWEWLSHSLYQSAIEILGKEIRICFSQIQVKAIWIDLEYRINTNWVLTGFRPFLNGPPSAIDTDEGKGFTIAEVPYFCWAHVWEPFFRLAWKVDGAVIPASCGHDPTFLDVAAKDEVIQVLGCSVRVKHFGGFHLSIDGVHDDNVQPSVVSCLVGFHEDLGVVDGDGGLGDFRFKARRCCLDYEKSALRSFLHDFLKSPMLEVLFLHQLILSNFHRIFRKVPIPHYYFTANPIIQFLCQLWQPKGPRNLLPLSSEFIFCRFIQIIVISHINWNPQIIPWPIPYFPHLVIELLTPFITIYKWMYNSFKSFWVIYMFYILFGFPNQIILH